MQKLKGVGVLLDVQKYEEMQNTIELFQDVQKSVAKIKDSKGVEHSEAKEQVLNRLANAN